jgi:DNA-binding NarL/FixJ family response regulator
MELVALRLGRTEPATLASIGELVRHDLVRSTTTGPYFTFRHPVVHRAVYHGIELSRRVQLHKLADGALLARGATASERAPHVEQSAKHGDLDAVDVLEAAARAASGTRPATAADWLTTALRLLPDQPVHQGRRADLLIRLAKARGSAGDLRECRDIMHLALPLLPPHPSASHAKAVAYTAMIQRLLGSHPETDAMLLAEVRALGDTDPAGLAALLFEIAARELNVGRWFACVERAQESLTIAQELGSRPRQLACHGLIAKANVVGGEFGQATRHLAVASAMLDRMLDGDFAFSLDAVVWIGWSYALLERWDDALRHFNKAVAFANRAGRLLALPHLLVGQVFALYNTGRLAEAQAAAEYAVYFVQPTGSPEQLLGAYSTLAWTDTITGRTERGMESIRVAAGQLHGPLGGFGVLAVRLLAEARLITGDAEGCLALATTVVGPDLMAADVCSRVAWYELLTRTELALGRPKGAGVWAEAAIDSASVLNQRGRNALAHLAWAQVQLVVDPENALSSAELAVSGLTAARMTVDALRAKVVRGMALWYHDRYAEAVRELKVAQTELERIGAVTLAKQALTERRRLSARTSRSPAGEHAGGAVGLLTDRERQIADLVRDGLTNRLIARALHISEKTVEMHLSKIFSKLGLSNRAAVAAFISRSWAADGSVQPR